MDRLVPVDSKKMVDMTMLLEIISRTSIIGLMSKKTMDV
jgi:hypothetical protein